MPTNGGVQNTDQFFDVIYGRSLRLSTPREAPDKFIGPTKFGELIYDNFLVDVPRIMDLCALFRHSSPKILSKMVASVFKHRPTYSSDLAVAASNICQSMSTVGEEFRLILEPPPLHCTQPE